MSSQHTPGPWKSLPEEADKPYIRIRGTALGRRYKIANVMDPTYNGATDQDFEETRANARLIAAAPEMLEVLQDMLYCSEYWSEYFVPLGLVERLNAVIKTATGEAT